MVARRVNVDEPGDTASTAGPAGPWPVVTAFPRWIPITDIPQLAAAARARGQTGRMILVDAADPPVIRTPNRVPGQWLGAGTFVALPIPCPWCGWWRDGACQCPLTYPDLEPPPD